jgi:hypothetical protein
MIAKIMELAAGIPSNDNEEQLHAPSKREEGMPNSKEEMKGDYGD